MKSYKEVNLPWLKEVPDGWEVKPIRDIFYERGEQTLIYKKIEFYL